MQKKASSVVVLGTGGTIAGTSADAGDNVGYTAAQLGVAQLVRAVPALQASSLEVEQVAQVDSKDMSHAVWRQLAVRVAHHLARADVVGIVVTHGTDTLEETAWFLQRVLAPGEGLIDNHAAARSVNALPIALSENCVLLRDIGKDEVITFDAVRLPSPTLSYELWLEQSRRWPIHTRIESTTRQPHRLVTIA